MLLFESKLFQKEARHIKKKLKNWVGSDSELKRSNGIKGILIQQIETLHIHQQKSLHLFLHAMTNRIQIRR